MAKTKYTINEYIRSPKIRLIDHDGEQVGIVPINEGMKRAREQHLDLVQIVDTADPPVCKIVDFSKFKYQQTRKNKAQKKHAKETTVKEIRLGPTTSQHDLEIRARKAQKFLEEGHRVKISVRFRGREITHKEFGYQNIEKILGLLEDSFIIETEPSLKGMILTAVILPAKK